MKYTSFTLHHLDLHMSQPRRPASAGSWRAKERNEACAYAFDVAGMKENRRPFDSRSCKFFFEVVGRRSQFHLHERLENIRTAPPRVRPIVPVFQNISVCFPSGRLLHTSARSVVAAFPSRPSTPLHFSLTGRAGLPTRGL